MKVAIQMDPLESLNPKTDSTLVLIQEALHRGFDVYAYYVDGLFVENGDICAITRPIKFVESRFLSPSEGEVRFLGDFDVILMRQDPPLNMDYLTCTYILEKFKNKVFNNPVGVRNLPEKLYASLEFAKFMPETLLTKDYLLAQKFFNTYQNIVIKPLHAFAGKDVFKALSEAELQNHFNYIISKYQAHVVLQRFVPEVLSGDKRIFLLDGKAKYAINRVPAEGEFLANLAVGGSATCAKISKREAEVCKAVGSVLKKHGILLAGVDIISGWLTEINVTCVTGVVAVNALFGLKDKKRFECDIWDAICAKLKRKLR